MGSLRLSNVHLISTAKVILLVENDFTLINRITQNVDKENKWGFF